MKTEFGLEKEKMRRDFNTTVASLESDFDKERSRLERERVEQQAALRKDVEYPNGELLARDPYTPLTDHELKSPFQGLGNEIDALSRLKWKSNQAEWPNDLLGRLSDNQRKVKKQLAQDIVWIILYEKIFCSPFRVFGEEGQRLELQWNEAYGKGYDPS
jgi:malate synthase